MIARAPKSSEFLFLENQGNQFEVNEAILMTQANYQAQQETVERA